MGSASAPSTAVSVIAAMITPALLILGSASLVASVLIRMGRVVDRARVLAALVQEGAREKLGVPTEELRAWLVRHAQRARYAERSILALYAAVVIFIGTCLSIALDRWSGGRLEAVPVVLAVTGSVLLLVGGGWMVAESRLAGEQIAEEIAAAISRLEEDTP